MRIGTTKHWFTAALLGAASCGDDLGGTSATTGTTITTASTAPATMTTSATGTGPTTGDSEGETDSSSTAPTTGGTSATSGTSGTTGTSATSGTSGTSAGGCGVCDEPNQQCVDDVCVTSCQGQDPSPCPQDQVCDVISGACKPVDAACTLAGSEAPCAGMSCGPGTVCDGIGACLPIAPCGDVACTGDGHC